MKTPGFELFSIFATQPSAVSVLSVSCLRKKSLFHHLNCFVLENRVLSTVLKGKPGGQMILLDLIYSNQ